MSASLSSVRAPVAGRRFVAGLLLLAGLAPACASRSKPDTEPTPRRPVARNEDVVRHDKTVEGAAIGAGVGAAGAILVGKRAADEILLGAAIGTAAGAGIGAYLDAQEAKLARVPGTTVERVDDDTLLVRFDSDVLFPVGSARPTPESLTTLAEVADVLVRYPRTAVVVQGHTDSTGTSQHNLELSERRALAVKDILVDRGVEGRRVAAIGNGEAYPVASNGFEEGRRRNRRVTVLLKGRA
jgi:outer membrane protein OmpA-like peptidoglycan-associated protein